MHLFLWGEYLDMSFDFDDFEVRGRFYDIEEKTEVLRELMGTLYKEEQDDLGDRPLALAPGVTRGRAGPSCKARAAAADRPSAARPSIRADFFRPEQEEP